MLGAGRSPVMGIASRSSRWVLVSAAVMLCLLTPSIVDEKSAVAAANVPTLCRDVSATVVSAIVGRHLPPTTGYVGTSETSPAMTEAITFCTYGPLASAFTTDTIEFSFATWSKAVSISLLKSSAEYNPNFTRVTSYTGLGVGALYMTGRIITGPEAAKRMPIESMVAFSGKREAGVEVNWHLSVATLARLEKLAVDKFLST